MVTLVAVGILLIAVGPSLAIWLVILQRRAHLLVIAILAAFMWCLAMMFAGAAWLAIPPLKNTFAWVLFVTVTMQEVVRLALYGMIRFVARRGEGAEAFFRPGVRNELLTGMAVGVGYSLMSVLIQFYAVIANEFSEDTAIYTDVCPHNFFVVAGAFSLAFSVLQIALGVWIWPAYSEDRGWGKVALGYGVHLGLSQISLVNQRRNACSWNLGLTYSLIVLASGAIGWMSLKRIGKE